MGESAGVLGGGLDRGRLLERADELDTVDGVITAAAAGQACLGIIEGPAGIGKSVLLEEARRHAEVGTTAVAFARASELERGFAYGIVRQLLEPVVARLTAAERTALFQGAARPAALVLGAEHDGESGASFGILHGLYWVILGLAARGPLVLCVDDVQWADLPSLRCLLHVARRIEGTAAGVLVAVRTAEPGAPDELLDELRAVDGARTVRPPPLTETAVLEVVRGALGETADEDFCRACHRASLGNPFYLRELVRTLRADTVVPAREQVERVGEVWPASIARHVLRRVARVGEDAGALAAAMAVLGDGGRLRHAAVLAGVKDAGTLARALRDMEVLAEEDPFRFLHPVVRGAVYADLTVHRREALHEHAARLLRDEGGEGSRVAAHLMAVSPVGRAWAVEALRAAAREAAGRGAPEVAVPYLRRALAETSRPGGERVAVLHELGLAEEQNADPSAIEHLREAAALCPDRAGRTVIALDLARTLETRGHEADAVAVIRSALREPQSGDDPRLQAALIGAAAVDARGMGPDVVELWGHLIADIPRGEPGQIVLAYTAGSMVWTGHPADKAVPLAEQACERGLLESEQWDAIGGCMWALILCERYEAVARHLDRLRAGVEQRGHARGLALVLQLQANRAERVGLLVEAETSARLALQIASDNAIAIGSLGWIVCSLVDALVARGDLGEADEVLAAMPATPWPQHVGCISTLAARGRLRLAQDRPGDALADLLEAGRLYAAWPSVPLDGVAPSHWRSSAALALQRLGEGDEARRLAAEEVTAARTFGTARATGVALRVAGMVASADDALPLLHASVEMLSGSQAALERARADVALGVALRRRGQRVAARDPLRAGLDEARRCGATPLVAFARDELTAAGARPRREAMSGLAALTTAERRVADLASEGLTNRQLAQTLYLSPKTVEMHLGRVYRKLDIAGRGALAAALTSSE